MKVEDWRQVRKIAYAALTAPYHDPRRLPKTEEKYLPLPGEQKIRYISEEVKQKFLQATAEYLKKKNG